MEILENTPDAVFTGLSSQIAHKLLQVASMNKIRVAREPRATGDFMKVKTLRALGQDKTIGNIKNMDE